MKITPYRQRVSDSAGLGGHIEAMQDEINELRSQAANYDLLLTLAYDAMAPLQDLIILRQACEAIRKFNKGQHEDSTSI